MGRIAEPLGLMGAAIETTGGGLPLVIEGRPLGGIDYTLPVASAQVKSAILLAGLGAAGRTTVHEPAPTRDHTELMLAAAGARVTRRPGSVTVEPASTLRLPEVLVPGDISSAAPFLTAAALLPGSTVTVHDLGLNPLRTGLLDVLERMGARVGVLNRRSIAGEAIGDVEVGRRRARRDDDRRRRGPAARRRAAAGRAARVDGARHDHRHRRGGAAREGVRPDRRRRSPPSARSARTPRRAPTAS